jgi:hypothetical protein
LSVRSSGGEKIYHSANYSKMKTCANQFFGLVFRHKRFSVVVVFETVVQEIESFSGLRNFVILTGLKSSFFNY